MNKIKSIALSLYNYTHLLVGAGAVLVSFLDSQQLPPKYAAGVVIASQALRVLSDWVTVAHGVAPLALKELEELIKEAESVVVVHPTSAPVAGATVTPVTAGVAPDSVQHLP